MALAGHNVGVFVRGCVCLENKFNKWNMRRMELYSRFNFPSTSGRGLGKRTFEINRTRAQLNHLQLMRFTVCLFTKGGLHRHDSLDWFICIDIPVIVAAWESEPSSVLVVIDCGKFSNRTLREIYVWIVTLYIFISIHHLDTLCWMGNVCRNNSNVSRRTKCIGLSNHMYIFMETIQ